MTSDVHDLWLQILQGILLMVHFVCGMVVVVVVIVGGALSDGGKRGKWGAGACAGCARRYDSYVTDCNEDEWDTYMQGAEMFGQLGYMVALEGLRRQRCSSEGVRACVWEVSGLHWSCAASMGGVRGPWEMCRVQGRCAESMEGVRSSWKVRGELDACALEAGGAHGWFAETMGSAREVRGKLHAWPETMG